MAFANQLLFENTYVEKYFYLLNCSCIVFHDAVNSFFRVFERDGAKVVVDEMSLDILKGSEIDYGEELIRSTFRVVSNPKAEMGCSCGVSFTLKPD